MLKKGPTHFTQQRRRARRNTRFFVLIGLVLFATATTVVGRALRVPHARVNNLNVPLASIEQWALSYSERWESTEVTLVAGNMAHRILRRDLGAKLPADEITSKIKRVSQWSEEQEVQSFEWLPKMAHADLLQSVFDLRERTLMKKSDDAEQTLDLHASLKLLKEALPKSSLFIELPMHTRSVSKRERQWETGAFAHLLGRHTSSYRPIGRSWGRGHNIEAAARALDGLVIDPHGELSFNEIVGQRSFQRGFMGAREIARGRVVNGIGGGVCQVATGLHDAALRAAFDIGEHYVHSKRPRYARRGIDSAVAWGLKDLTIRNPYENHVRIQATAQAGRLIVELWSADEPPKVEMSTNVKSGSLKDRHELMIVERARTVHWPEGARTDVKVLRYPAEPRD